MLKALPTREAEPIAKVLFNRIWLRGRSPRALQSDLARKFLADIMQELVKLMGAKFKHSSPYRPQTNTHVERYMKTLATHMSLLLERPDQRDWDEHIKFVQYAQLVGAQKVLGRFSPLFPPLSVNFVKST